MTKVVEATYSEGCLIPVESLDLAERQRVRVIVQKIDGQAKVDRAEAMRRLREGIKEMNFRLEGPLPTRDELHERPGYKRSGAELGIQI